MREEALFRLSKLNFQIDTPIILIFVILLYFCFLYHGRSVDLLICISSMILTVILQIRYNIVRYILL